MKTLALVLLALPTLLPQSEGVLLRRTFKADAVETYKITDTVTETVKSPMGELPVAIASTRNYVVKTTKVDEAAGTAQIEATTTVESLKADGPAAGMMNATPKPLTQKGKLDVRGRTTFEPVAADNSLTSLLGGLQGSSSSGTFVEFPEKAVKIGDSWDIVVPKNPLVYDVDQKLRATLTGEKTIDGTAVWVVSIKGTVLSAVDTSKLPNAKGIDTPMGPTSIRIKGQIDLTGEGFVDKATGQTLTMTTKGTTKMAMELVDSGLSFDTVGTIESVARLQKAP